MAIQRINYGAAPDDGTGDPLRDAWIKTDNNFVDLENRKANGADVATALAGKVDKVTGKGLSTEDYTSAEKQKLADIQPNATQNRPDSENADAAALADKVDKVAGSRLMTDAEGTKLAGVATGATANQTDAYLVDRNNHTGTQSIATVSGLADGLRGMRNKIINGTFQVNTRSYVSGAATVAGRYTLDRWKVTGTNGVTFASDGGKTTVTIPAGQTLVQVVEGINLSGGQYVLSWEGTAMGRIGSGSFGASGTVTATIVGGANTAIEFNTGTVTSVQLERGQVPTVFDERFLTIEETLCQRYCAAGGLSGTAYATNATTELLLVPIRFAVRMRAAPTMTLTYVAGNVARFELYRVATTGADVGFVKSGSDPYVTAVYNWLAETEL